MCDNTLGLSEDKGVSGDRKREDAAEINEGVETECACCSETEGCHIKATDD